MTLAYFDCFSGISGDMTLARSWTPGVSYRAPARRTGKTGTCPAIPSQARKSHAQALAATKVNVMLDRKKQPARHLSDIRTIIEGSSLSPAIKQKSIAIFERLAEAEAAVHGTTPEKVHFHEVGAVDAIVDIVGVVIGLELLGVTRIIASPMNLGSGSVHTSHGKLPVPAPATAELLKGIPVYSSAISLELTTPTGAAIISTLCSSFGPLPQMKVSRIAHGAGGKTFRTSRMS